MFEPMIRKVVTSFLRRLFSVSGLGVGPLLHSYGMAESDQELLISTLAMLITFSVSVIWSAWETSKEEKEKKQIVAEKQELENKVTTLENQFKSFKLND